MALTVGETYRCAIVWKLDNTDEQVNVHHVTMTGTQPSTELAARTDLYEYFEDLYSDVLLDVTNNVIHQRIDVWHAISGNPEFTGAGTSTLDGTGSAEYLPEGVCAFTWGRTGIKRRIARKYLPTFGETSITDGEWTTTVKGRLAAFCGKWESTFNAANGSSWHSVVFTPPTIVTDIITGLYASRPAYQRRRRKGRGS